MLEKQIISKALDEYAEVLGDRSCNDYYIEDTPENRAFVERFNAWYLKDDPNGLTLEFYKGRAIGYDWLIMKYLKHWIGSIV